MLSGLSGNTVKIIAWLLTGLGYRNGFTESHLYLGLLHLVTCLYMYILQFRGMTVVQCVLCIDVHVCRGTTHQ